MPFYRAPDDDHLTFIEDVRIGLGMMSADDDIKRFVSLVADGHVIGLDYDEITMLLPALEDARRELKALNKQDRDKETESDAVKDTTLQSTQFLDRDDSLN